MKVHYDSWVAKLLPKHKAITLFGHVFFKQKQEDVSLKLFFHELKHCHQMDKLGYFSFYFIYFYEWIRNIIRGQNLMDAYRNISFEIEAVEFSIKMTQGNK